MMLQVNIRHIILFCLMFCSFIVNAQNNSERDFLRSGNKLYRDSIYTKAEIDYRKAIELNPRFSQGHYNLGDALLRQQKPKEAMEAFEQALKTETNKYRLSKIHHNMGVIFQSQKQFAQAIECYKDALRKNPNDDESRYNLVLCQHQLKNNPKQDENKNDDKDKQDGNSQNQNKDDKSDKKDKDNNQNNNAEKEKQQQQQESGKMSKENAEQLLNAAMQDERQTQERIKKAMSKPQSRRLEKQW